MTELLTAAQMRAIERAAIESGEVTGLELMERAGKGVVEAVFEEWPELAQGSFRAVVLCGPGNNGGDGFVVARLLKDWGWEVEVFFYGDPDKLPPDARVNYERWLERGEVRDAGIFVENELEARPQLIVDALFGTGLVRPVFDPVLWERLWNLEDCTHAWLLRQSGRGTGIVPPRSVAIDISTGLDADSGRILGHAEHGRSCAEVMLTVTFHAPKLGHFVEDGPAVSGRLVVKDIGIRGEKSSGVRLVSKPTPYLGKKTAHKYTHGHALILSGGPGHTGAARLAARGALRIGAGLVTLGVPPAAQQEVAAQVTAIMLKRVGDGPALGKILEDQRINALCLGPALGLERARALVGVALGEGGQIAHPTRYVVLDADALTGFADAPETLFSMLHEGCVLTPHGGEFARLFPDIAEKLAAPATKGPAYSKVDATREAAARAGCTVLFKGPDTVIASPDGTCAINSSAYERAAPWLANAGSGDVLAGFITGLLARGFAPQQAAETGAWLHTECALSFGPGLIAEDLPEELPKVFRALGA